MRAVPFSWIPSPGSAPIPPSTYESYGRTFFNPQRSSISAIDAAMSFRMANSFGPHEQLMRSCGMPYESTFSGSSFT